MDFNRLTIKSGEGVGRQEFEVEISTSTFEKLWPLTQGARVAKTRYTLQDGEYSWEVDEYGESLRGLYIAEVELTSDSEQVTPPALLVVVRDVTQDERYKNRNLAIRGVPATS